MHSSKEDGALFKKNEEMKEKTHSPENPVEFNLKNIQAADSINQEEKIEGKNFIEKESFIFLNPRWETTMKPRTSLIVDKTRTFVGDHLVTIEVFFDDENNLYANVTYDGGFKAERSRNTITKIQENPENQEIPNDILQTNQETITKIQSLHNDISKLFVDFQKDTVSELKSINNNTIQNIVETNLSNQKFQENSATSLQFLIESSQKNQDVFQNIISLINRNQTQIIDKFTSFSTLMNELKESFGNQILKRFEVHLKQFRSEYDQSLHSQIITNINTLIQNNIAAINTQFETYLNRFNSNSNSMMKQILNKLNNQSMEEVIRKKLKKIMNNISEKAEKILELENVIEAVGQESVKEVDKKLEFLFEYLKTVNQDNQAY
jgi:hypothetical protein